MRLACEHERYGRKGIIVKEKNKKGFLGLIITSFIAIEGQRLTAYSPAPEPGAGGSKVKGHPNPHSPT